MLFLFTSYSDIERNVGCTQYIESDSMLGQNVRL